MDTGNGTRTSRASTSAALAADAGVRSTLGTAVRFPGEDGGSSLAAMAQSDLDAALQLLADRAQYITGANGAAIALRRTGKNDMQCRASSGANVPELGALLSTEFGLSGESVRTRRALCCDDAERDPRVNREGCRQLGIASVVVMPVVNDDEVMGVFELFSGKVNAFGERDLSALQRLSEMVETAVKLARAAESVPSMASASEAESAVGDDDILGEEILEVQEPVLEAAVEEPAEKLELDDPGAGVQAEENSPTTALEALRQPEADALSKSQGLPALPTVEAPAAGAAALSAQVALPKKPLFWSAAMSPAADAGMLEEIDQSHVPPVLRNLRICEACGFPVSPGRALCVECEEKRWRGTLKRPSVRLPLSAGAASKSKSPPFDTLRAGFLAKDARNGAPDARSGVPITEVASSGPVARLVAAAAAQSGAAAAPAPARESVAAAVAPVPTLASPGATPEFREKESEELPKEVAILAREAAVVNPPEREGASAVVATASETPSPEFVLSAGLEPSQSWLAANVYVVVVVLLIGALVAATVLLH